MGRPFRLAAVIRLREARRDAARQHLADAMRAAAVLEEQQAALRGRFEALLAERRSAAARVDTAWLLSAGRYELVLRADERALKEKVLAVDQEIERRRQLVAEADRELRAVEVLRERFEASQRKEEARRESRRLDEHGSQAFHRRRIADMSPDPAEAL